MLPRRPSFYFFCFLCSNNGKVMNRPLANSQPNRIFSLGQEKAILTLANGKQIELDEKQGIQTANGQISYQNGAAITQGEELQEVVLTTPLAAQYKAILPDGTAAWLNAGSSIRYPTKFTGNKRSVYITGEVYFEVAKNPSKPFFVYCDQQVLQVLGTTLTSTATAISKRKSLRRWR